MLPQIDPAHHLVGGQLLGAAGLEDFALEHQIGPVGDGEGLLHVVVGDEDADIAGLEAGNVVLDILHRDGVDTGEGFVEEDEFGVGGQGAGDLGAPPLTAGEGVAVVLAHLVQVELVDQSLQAVALLGPGEAGHFQHRLDIVLHAELTEHRGFLGQVTHPQASPPVHG